MNLPSSPHLQAAHARAEALAHAIQAASEAAPAHLHPALHALVGALRDGTDLGLALKHIEEEGLAEKALDWVRSHRRSDAPLRAKLEPLAAKAKAIRASRIHLEGDRVLARARYRKVGAALLFGTPDLQTLFLEVLRMEGLPLELDLAKRPRPLLSCAPPLPPEVAGDQEWLEMHLLRSAVDPDLLPRVNRRLPEGLSLLDWEEQPIWASPVAELCTAAHWVWPVDDAAALTAVESFLSSESFYLEKVGKVEGQKQEKRQDLRPIVLHMECSEKELHFTTALGPYAALNPLKLLGAILGRAPETIQGLRRTGFDMAEDPRLKKGDRYTSKLKNMYEDAVLLGASSNITMVDEEDEEPLTLG